MSTKFLPTGFPDSRSKYLKKISKSLNDDEEDSMPKNINPAHIVKNKDTGEEYYCPPSIHDQYAARPPKLEEVCLAQCRMWYYLGMINNSINFFFSYNSFLIVN